METQGGAVLRIVISDSDTTQKLFNGQSCLKYHKTTILEGFRDDIKWSE